MIRLAKVAACALVAQRAEISQIMLMPDPPIPGQNQTLVVDYVLGGVSAVTGGTTTYAYTLNYIPFAPTVTDLCTQTKCPIELGAHTEQSSYEFPTGVTGLFDTKITWTDENEVPIWCVEMTYKVSTDPPLDGTQ